MALGTIRNLDYVVLLCNDLERMKHFYHEIMGFRVLRDWGEWYEMQVGAVALTLRPRGRDYDGEGGSGASVQLAFRVAPDDVDGCYAELMAQQLEILEVPTDKDYGHKTLFFRDPEGNVLEIYADISVRV